ncbi:GGDEF domain-containing protein [Ferrimonas senticii]|uniref:GGDEF domain-containing protein n=1 Tax=Ferrimonas senticii TaxID=394566 RepID=UPI0004008156|nr:GGDEF domain-containing protein [Ferrimonas senticii]
MKHNPLRIHRHAQLAMLLTIIVLQSLQALLAIPQWQALPWLLAPVPVAIAAQWHQQREPSKVVALSWTGLLAITLAASLPWQPQPELTLLLLLAAMSVMAHSPLAFTIAVVPSLLMWLYLQLNLVLMLASLAIALLLGFQTRMWQHFAKLNQRHHQRLQRQIDRRSNRHPLTKLANQRYFEQRLQQTVFDARRSKTPLSLIVLDIDYFHSYHSYYGKDAANQVLQQLARLIKAVSQRQSDIIAYLEDGTFALLLPTTDQHGAERLANQIANNVIAADMPHSGSPISDRITLSQGISQWQRGMDPQQLLSRANQTLAEAKQQGRDRIKVA